MARRTLDIDPKDGCSMRAAAIAALFARDYAEAVHYFGDWNRFYPGIRWSYTKHGVALAMNS